MGWKQSVQVSQAHQANKLAKAQLEATRAMARSSTHPEPAPAPRTQPSPGLEGEVRELNANIKALTSQLELLVAALDRPTA